MSACKRSACKNWCQIYSNILEIGTFNCYWYRLITSTAVISVRDCHPIHGNDIGPLSKRLRYVCTEHYFAKKFCKKIYARIFHERFILGRVFHVRFAMRNCGAASVLQVYRHCSCKEGSAGLVLLQDVPNASWSRTFFCPHQLARGADKLETSWRRVQPNSGQNWNPSPDCESWATYDGERTGWTSLVSSHRTVSVTIVLWPICGILISHRLVQSQIRT